MWGLFQTGWLVVSVAFGIGHRQCSCKLVGRCVVPQHKQIFDYETLISSCLLLLLLPQICYTSPRLVGCLSGKRFTLDVKNVAVSGLFVLFVGTNGFLATKLSLRLVSCLFWFLGSCYMNRELSKTGWLFVLAVFCVGRGKYCGELVACAVPLHKRIFDCESLISSCFLLLLVCWLLLQ